MCLVACASKRALLHTHGSLKVRDWRVGARVPGSGRVTVASPRRVEGTQPWLSKSWVRCAGCPHPGSVTGNTSSGFLLTWVRLCSVHSWYFCINCLIAGVVGGSSCLPAGGCPGGWWSWPGHGLRCTLWIDPWKILTRLEISLPVLSWWKYWKVVVCTKMLHVWLDWGFSPNQLSWA